MTPLRAVCTYTREGAYVVARCAELDIATPPRLWRDHAETEIETAIARALRCSRADICFTHGPTEDAPAPAPAPRAADPA